MEMNKYSGNTLLSNNYKVLPVKINESFTSTHYLFYKLHQIRDQNNKDRPCGRTLFVVNIPPYCTEECLQRLFSDCGAIEKVTFLKNGNSETLTEKSFFSQQNLISGYKVAYVVFSKNEQCVAAMNISETSPRVLSSTEYPVSTGIKKWCEEYNRNILDIAAVEDEINNYMDNYDKDVQSNTAKEKEMAGVPDDEGWIKVTKHGKVPVTRRTEGQGRKAMRRVRKKNSQTELLNFYSFQIRESKMDHIVQLRKKFEEDKQRIALLKAARKFKPY